MYVRRDLMIPVFLSTLVLLKGMEQRQIPGAAAGDLRLPHAMRAPTLPGCSLGKHQGITRVSPNKSLEGYVGGILSGAACSCCSTASCCSSSPGLR